MTFSRPDDDDFVRMREFPGASLVKVALALAIGAGIFVLIFHVLAWIIGWPGPLLWFGSESRMRDIVTVALSVPLYVFLMSLFGVAVVKIFAKLSPWFNFRVRVR